MVITITEDGKVINAGYVLSEAQTINQSGVVKTIYFNIPSDDIKRVTVNGDDRVGLRRNIFLLRRRRGLQQGVPRAAEVRLVFPVANGAVLIEGLNLCFHIPVRGHRLSLRSKISFPNEL